MRKLATGMTALALAGCQASTTRPLFAPLPEAARVEVHLTVPEATLLLAEALRADSFPVARVEARDGWLESDWFSFPGFLPVSDRILGPAEEKLRAWVDPQNPGPPATTLITLEVVYRLYEDPSRPEREAERHVQEGHTARERALAVLHGLVARYGDSAAVRRDTMR